MNNPISFHGDTIPGQSFEFGKQDQPAFEPPAEPSVVQSVVLGFEVARPFMSGKPLRRPRSAGFSGKRRCVVHLIPEEGGGFSVIAAELPGIASQGDTEEEALANIREALEGAISYYKDEKRPVPWLSAPEEPESGAKPLSVFVHG